MSFPPLWVWAARDVIRRPFEGLLLGVALASLVTLCGTALLLSEALSATARGVLAAGPSLVVRRTGPGGWAPLPVAEAVAAAEAVPGVVAARPRVWGVVRGPSGPLTVVALMEPAPDLGLALLGSGEAVVGAGVATGDGLVLSGACVLRPRVREVLSPETSLAAHDLVLLPPEDARRVLGLSTGHASDLAIDVFHEAEQEAILPDLAQAFPWPVQLTTRRQALGAYTGGLTRRGGIAVLVLLPAALAALLLALAAARGRALRPREVGLLKACGWTTGDVVRLLGLRALVVALPAVALGLAAALCLVLWPGVTWPGEWLLGWEGPPPPLHLEGGGVLLVLVEVTALVLCPWLLATALSGLRQAAVDPQPLLEAPA